MNEYFEILPLTFHLMLALTLAVGVGFSKYARERLNPSFESPLIWREKKPSPLFHALVIEEGFISSAMFGLALVMFIEFKWWHALIFIIEITIIPGILLVFIEQILRRFIPDTWLTVKSISIVLDILIFLMIFTNLPATISVLDFQVPLWIFLLLSGGFKVVFGLLRSF